MNLVCDFLKLALPACTDIELRLTNVNTNECLFPPLLG